MKLRRLYSLLSSGEDISDGGREEEVLGQAAGVFRANARLIQFVGSGSETAGPGKGRSMTHADLILRNKILSVCHLRGTLLVAVVVKIRCFLLARNGKPCRESRQ